ncbi:MAG: hypothetical protein ACI86H_003078 [bacterium]|jgi:hypothetical protein
MESLNYLCPNCQKIIEVRRTSKYKKASLMSRVVARLIDLLVVLLIALAFQKILYLNSSVNIVFGLWVYNVVAILFGGNTLGRLVLSTYLYTSFKNSWNTKGLLIIRETLFMFLFPLIVLCFPFSSKRLLHDRITKVQVFSTDK